MAVEFSPTVEIVPLSQDRILAAAELYHDVWHQTQAPLQDVHIAKSRGPTFFQARLGKWRNCTLLAQRGEGILGLSSWQGSVLKALFVQSKFQHLGFGSALLWATEKELQGDEITLQCICGNDSALRFYQRHGWKLDYTLNSPVETDNGQFNTPSWQMVKRRNP